MYILTKEDNVILNITPTLNRQKETNYYLVNNDSLAIPTEFVTEVYENVEVPERITVERYCYDGNEFYKNLSYKEYYSEEDRIEALEDMVNMLLMGGE